MNAVAQAVIVLGVAAALIYLLIIAPAEKAGEQFWTMVEVGYGLLIGGIVFIVVVALIELLI